MTRGDWIAIGIQLVATIVFNLILWLWLAPIYIRWAVQQP
jgi:hypothetical protein